MRTVRPLGRTNVGIVLYAPICLKQFTLYVLPTIKLSNVYCYRSLGGRYALLGKQYYIVYMHQFVLNGLPSMYFQR